MLSVSPTSDPVSESRRTSIFPPTAPYCAGALTPNTISDIPLRSSWRNRENEPDLFGIVIGTGICGTCIFDTPSPSSPVATTIIGARSTTVLSASAPGSPFAPLSVYSARSTTAPPVGELDCVAAAGGVYSPRAGSDGPLFFWPRLRMYDAICVVCASVSCGCGGIITCPHTPEPPVLIFVASRASAAASPRYFVATSVYDGPTDLRSI